MTAADGDTDAGACVVCAVTSSLLVVVVFVLLVVEIALESELIGHRRSLVDAAVLVEDVDDALEASLGVVERTHERRSEDHGALKAAHRTGIDASQRTHVLHARIEAGNADGQRRDLSLAYRVHWRRVDEGQRGHEQREQQHCVHCVCVWLLVVVGWIQMSKNISIYTRKSSRATK